MDFPSMNLPGISTSPVNAANLQTNPLQVYSLLSNAPTSMTASLGPLLQQVFGTSGNMMQPFFQNQTNANVASAQSDAMARGLTGSSIEAGNMTAARTQGAQGYDQYLAQMLQSLVPSYMGAAQFDIGNQNAYYNNLAQAVGQQYGNIIQQQEFQKNLDAQMSMANSSNTSAMIGAGMGAAGQIGAAALPLMFSDIRLKENIVPIGSYKGHKWYQFNYKNVKGLPGGTRIGVMGHEVMESRPDCIGIKDGYLTVDYKRLLNA